MRIIVSSVLVDDQEKALALLAHRRSVRERLQPSSFRTLATTASTV